MIVYNFPVKLAMDMLKTSELAKQKEVSEQYSDLKGGSSSLICEFRIYKSCAKK